MPVEFTMPKLGLTMEEGTIREWLVPDGSPVTAGMSVLVIETDKTETEVEVSGTGVLQWVAAVGDTLRCGGVIGLLLADGESPTQEPAPQPAGGRIIASPNARRVAAELGVEIAAVRGTGPGGRITSEDVTDMAAMPSSPAARSGAMSTQPASSASQVDKPATALPAGRGAVAPPGGAPVASVAARQLADLLGIDLAEVPADPTEGRVTRDGVAAHVRARLAQGSLPAPAPATPTTPLLQMPSELIPMTGMRGTIAKRMHGSLRDMAQLTLTMDASMAAVVRHRDKRKKHVDEGTVIPGYTDYIVAATARALRQHPRVNAEVVGDEIALLPDIHVGLAVALDDGLVVPVVRHADRLSLTAIAAETTRLAAAARARSLALTDMEGGTFSVTALGSFGVDGFTPVINPPNAGILGVGRLRDVVGVRKGKVSTTPALTLSLTWDHRVFDGAPAAAFARTIVELLDDPEALENE
jgi:pyruvate dehydrogenase E2 component (dihydrolipoamide acetyltransferase)